MSFETFTDSLPNYARDIRISRRSWLLAGLTIGVSGLRAEDPLEVSFDGDNLRVAAPGLHFLTGKPLARLRDAATVTFLSQLTLSADRDGRVIVKRAPERLVVSYDLWEEKFSVTIPGTGQRRPFIGNAAQTESWWGMGTPTGQYVSVLQSWAEWSSPPVHTRLPSGLKATARTQ